MSPKKGIDISHYQIVTNWNLLQKAVEFIILKATQGHALSSSSYNFTDSKFHEYIKEAIRRGIPVGAYHFFTGRTVADAIAEADYFCQVIAPYKDKLICAVCDAENYGNKYLLGLSRSQLSANIKAFCDRVKANGYNAVHYTNTNHVQSFINLSEIPYPVWQAHYLKTPANPEKLPFSSPNLYAWQYSSTGSVPGIKGNVDLDFGYFDLKQTIIPDTTQVVDNVSAIHEGDTVKVKSGAMYKGGIAVPARLYGLAYTAGRVVGNYVYIEILNSWIQVDGFELIRCEVPDYASLVCEKCGFEEQTKTYLNAYKWASDLWRKLWENMK